jgi:hypothetical protein
MAYEFNGTNQFLQINSAVVTSAPLTMACWFNCDRNDLAYVILSITGNATAGTGATRFALFAEGGVVGDPVRIIATNTAGQNGFTDSTAAFSAGKWHHACGVFSSATSRSIYLDGGNSSTNGTNITPTLLSRTVIAAQYREQSGGITGCFDGLTAEVGIWNAALTADEVASLAKGMTCDKVRPQSLVFYAPLVRNLIDQKSGLTITNNNGATVANHPRVYA